MNSKQKVNAALHHKSTDSVPIDFGGTVVTGIHRLSKNSEIARLNLAKV